MEAPVERMILMLRDTPVLFFNTDGTDCIIASKVELPEQLQNMKDTPAPSTVITMSWSVDYFREVTEVAKNNCAILIRWLSCREGNYALSTDEYWVKESKSKITWDEVKGR